MVCCRIWWLAGFPPPEAAADKVLSDVCFLGEWFRRTHYLGDIYGGCCSAALLFSTTYHRTETVSLYFASNRFIISGKTCAIYDRRVSCATLDNFLSAWIISLYSERGSPDQMTLLEMRCTMEQVPARQHRGLIANSKLVEIVVRNF